MSLESLKYSRGSLTVLDQLLLPHETKYVAVQGTEDAWSVIRTMQVRGAPLIAITAALGLAVETEQHRASGKFSTATEAAAFLLQSMERLRTSRPTAVNLFTAMDELTALVTDLSQQEKQSANSLLESFIQAAEEMLAEDIATNKAIGRHGAEKILQLVKRDKVRVLTICNTGSLATAGYGTALGVVRALHEMGRLEHIFACETRPYNQGARLTAFEIVHDQLPGTLITDNMAAALMAVKGVDVVVVGADRVAANGDTANKIGTYQLAILASYHQVPFFPAVPSTTLDLSLSSGADIHVEERPAKELTTMFGQQIAPEGIAVWNPAFDLTPCSLISGVVTEYGVVEPSVPLAGGVSRNSDIVIPIAQFLLDKLERAEGQGRGRSGKEQKLLERCRRAVQPISVPVGYTRMNNTNMLQYILSSPPLRSLLSLSPDEVARGRAGESVVEAEEVGDGNLNFVYIVKKRGEEKGVVLKQALPYVRCVGEDWPLSLQRAEFEYSALLAEREKTGGRFVPEVFFFDRTHCLIAMQFLSPPLKVLRKCLMQRERVSSFAKEMGHFLALTLFQSSALFLPGGELRQSVAKWSRNTALCALTEKVIFTDPYTSSPLNRHTAPFLDLYAQAIRCDSSLKLAASHFKQIFLTKTESLLHGDLHTGSVMACEGQTYVIDPEFAFYGPMGFDIGALLSNLYLSYFAHSVGGEEGREYGEWILQQISVLYAEFVMEFDRLWEREVQEKGGLGELYVSSVYSKEELERARRGYLGGVWRESVGFGGMKMLRRVIGIAHVADLESIADAEQRSVAEKRALLFARRAILAAFEDQLEREGLGAVGGLNDLARGLAGTSPADAWPGSV